MGVQLLAATVTSTYILYSHMMSQHQFQTYPHCSPSQTSLKFSGVKMKELQVLLPYIHIKDVFAQSVSCFSADTLY